MNCNYPTRYEEVTPTVQAGAYAAGDAFGQKFVFNAAFRESPSRGGVLETVTIIGLNTSTFQVDILFFDEDFQQATDNSPFSITDLDMIQKCLGKVTVLASDWITTANHAVATVNGIGMALQTKANGNLYCQMIARGAVTPGSTSDYTVKLGILKD
jgi:hypothetical protein